MLLCALACLAAAPAAVGFAPQPLRVLTAPIGQRPLLPGDTWTLEDPSEAARGAIAYSLASSGVQTDPEAAALLLRAGLRDDTGDADGQLLGASVAVASAALLEAQGGLATLAVVSNATVDAEGVVSAASFLCVGRCTLGAVTSAPDNGGLQAVQWSPVRDVAPAAGAQQSLEMLRKAADSLIYELERREDVLSGIAAQVMACGADECVVDPAEEIRALVRAASVPGRPIRAMRRNALIERTDRVAEATLAYAPLHRPTPAPISEFARKILARSGRSAGAAVGGFDDDELRWLVLLSWMAWGAVIEREAPGGGGEEGPSPAAAQAVTLAFRTTCTLDRIEWCKNLAFNERALLERHAAMLSSG